MAERRIYASLYNAKSIYGEKDAKEYTPDITVAWEDDTLYVHLQDIGLMLTLDKRSADKLTSELMMATWENQASGK